MGSTRPRIERSRHHLSQRQRRAEARLIAAMLEGRDAGWVDDRYAWCWLAAELGGTVDNLRIVRRGRQTPALLDALAVAQLLQAHPPDVVRGYRTDTPRYHVETDPGLPLLPQSLLAVWQSFPDLDCGVGLAVDEKLIEPISFCFLRGPASARYSQLPRVREACLHAVLPSLQGKVWTVTHHGRQAALLRVPLEEEPGDVDDDVAAQLSTEVAKQFQHQDLLRSLGVGQAPSFRIEFPDAEPEILRATLGALRPYGPVFYVPPFLSVATPLLTAVARRFAPSMLVFTDNAPPRPSIICEAVSATYA